MAHVLVVDDDEDIRLAMRTLLEEVGGHSVEDAPNGETALEILRSSPHNLVVLLDLLMPGMDGLAVLKAVAADETLSTRHRYMLVTVSRRAISADFPDSLALMVPVIPKPFDMDDLLQEVDNAERSLKGDQPGPTA
jgi:CheY-like chemotaxis protein